jgi:hypothetical protein
MKDIFGPATSMALLTRRGDRVEINAITPQDGNGNPTTFPVRGTIYTEGRPYKEKPQSWTLDGRASLFAEHVDDILDMPDIS